MPTQARSPWRILLDTRQLDDLARESLVAAIVKMSATSALMAYSSVAAGVAALAKKASALHDGNVAVAADQQQLRNDILLRDDARVTLDLELVALKALVLNYARSAGDVTGLAYTLSTTQQASKTTPDAPEAGIVRIGRVRGTARVVVPTTGREHFVAQCAPHEPGAPASIAEGAWAYLPGNGKQRKLTGASGTQVWVRFAQVRYGLQSPWSMPVLVTFP